MLAGGRVNDMKGKKKMLTWIVGFILVFFLVNMVASLYFYNLAIARNVKDFLKDNSDLKVSAEAMNVFLEGDWRHWRDQQPFENWELTSFDGLTLQGYYLKAKQPTNQIVILAHGYLGRGSDMALYGQHYYENLGFDIFYADARGHGKSEGDYIGFGWHDRLDLVAWINKIIEEKGDDVDIVLHGLSMGAATVLMTSGEDLPINVKAIIADSPYTNVQDLFAYQMKRMYHLPSFPVLNTTSLVTKLKAGYSFTEASALEQVKKATVPILYIHGEADTFVPTELSMLLYEETHSEADLLLIPNAGHGEGFVIEKEMYLETLHHFLKKHLTIKELLPVT